MSNRVETAESLYAALKVFDKDRIREILTPDFKATITAGMPYGLGGRYEGSDTVIEEVWTKAGSHFVVMPEIDRYFEAGDDHLAVLGRYVGKARGTGKKFDAAFAHILAFREDRVSELIQVTDTATWAAALAEG